MYFESCLTEQGQFSNASCLPNQNLHCATNGELAGFCSCNTNFYFNNVTSRCEAKHLNLEYCFNVTQCRSDLGLRCYESVCQCNSTYYWSTSNSICGNFGSY